MSGCYSHCCCYSSLRFSGLILSSRSNMKSISESTRRHGVCFRLSPDKIECFGHTHNYTHFYSVLFIIIFMYRERMHRQVKKKKKKKKEKRRPHLALA